jgi:hypothetical protein
MDREEIERRNLPSARRGYRYVTEHCYVPDFEALLDDVYTSAGK